MIPVFDGHNDALLRLRREGLEGAEERFILGSPQGHVDLPKAKAGGLVGGLCAVYAPSLPDAAGGFPPLDRAEALDVTLSQVALLRRIEAASGGGLTVCTSGPAIRAAMERNSFAAVLHLEGAEAVGPDLDLLHVLHSAGLRTVGPVWARQTIFAHGVPFRFPSSPDIGPGLTAEGEAFVRLCNRLKIMLDLSHLNEAGFWDVARLSDAPLVASHSNAHAICPHSRNLTDRQLDAIAASGGLVGLNFGVRFLDPEGRRDPDLALEAMVRHIDHIVERVGLAHVALGSDFDGTLVPTAIGDATGLPRLFDALAAAGYSEQEQRQIGFGNWLTVLDRTWH